MTADLRFLLKLQAFDANRFEQLAYVNYECMIQNGCNVERATKDFREDLYTAFALRGYVAAARVAVERLDAVESHEAIPTAVQASSFETALRKRYVDTAAVPIAVLSSTAILTPTPPATSRVDTARLAELETSQDHLDSHSKISVPSR